MLQEHLVFLHICFSFYFVQFAFRAIEGGGFKQYVRENKTEWYLFVLLILSMLARLFLNFSPLEWLISRTGIESQEQLYLLQLHFLLLLIVGIEMGRAAQKSTIWKLSLPLLLILSFVVLVVIGSALLMLPEMTAEGKGMTFVDALFTSVSANCVTGLTVIDTASFFSIKGHVLLLFLIQIGGLNIIFFATLFISNWYKSVHSQSEDLVVREMMHTDSTRWSNTKNLLKSIVLTSLAIEFAGAILIYNQWGPELAFSGNGEKVFYSIFHSVSAFNNAGFSLFSDGLINNTVVGATGLHLAMALLIVLGGIGFTTMWEIGNVRRWFAGRPAQRLRLTFGSRIAIGATIILVGAGTLLFHFFESDGTLAGKTGTSPLTASLFQSITARTAGFNTLPIEELGTASAVLMIALMFIGASSGSTGGGIKTSTMAVLVSAAVERVRRPWRGPAASEMRRSMVKKALLIVGSSLIVVSTGVIILSFSERELPMGDLLFEEVSAFGTVGLSRGITGELTTVGKGVVMGTMFIGRVGPLAIAYALINHKSDQGARDGEEPFIIG